MEVEGKRLCEIIPNELCELCSEKGANGYCAECENFMCKVCFQQHVKTKLCREHVLSDSKSDVRTLEKDEVKCDIHDKETIRFYCANHENVGCGDCIILNHRLCEVQYIKDISERCMTEGQVAVLSKRIEKLKEHVGNGLQQVKQNQDNNISCKNTVLEDIRKRRREVDTMLEKAEGLLYAKANEIHDKNTLELKKLLDAYENVQRKYETLEKGLNEVCGHWYQEFIWFVKEKTILPELEKQIEKMKSETKTITYNFKPNRDTKFELGNLQKKENIQSMETSQD